MNLELAKPDHLDVWLAIFTSNQRLLRAADAGDRSQCIGSMKDLLESVAKVVVTTRGETVEPNVRFPKVITRAHVALERQPGEGLVADSPLREIAQSAMTIATQFAQLRNAMGTGHGRAYEPEIEDEMFEVGMEAGMLWLRWALRRLGAMAFGLPKPLVNDLRRGTPFRRGAVAARLEAAHLESLDEAEQRRVGVAVGQRAMRETFLVREEGVRACANSTDLVRWPPAYRIGVMEGLFFNDREQLTLDNWMADVVSQVIAPHPDLGRHLTVLAERISSVPDLVSETDVETALSAHEMMRAGRDLLPESTRKIWDVITGAINPGPL